MKRIVTTLLLASFVSPVLAQQIIPNPLVNPRQSVGQAGSQGAPSGASSSSRSYPPAPQSGGAPAGSGGMGSVNGAPEIPASTEPLPRSMENRFTNVYVSSIVGKTAVLRTAVMALGGGLAQAAGGVSPFAAFTGQPNPTGAQSTAQPNAPAVTPPRSAMYVVRDGELFRFFGDTVLYPRVQEKMVSLYLVPEGEDGEKMHAKKLAKLKLVYQGAVDALSSPAYVPVNAVKEIPDSTYRNAVLPAAPTAAYGQSLSSGNGSGGNINPAPTANNVGAMR